MKLEEEEEGGKGTKAKMLLMQSQVAFAFAA